MSEKNVDNLIENLLRNGQKGYPKEPDREENGITWYSQDSYKTKNRTLANLLKNASKTQKGNAGTPDFTIDTPNFYIVIEDKKKADDTLFCGYPDVRNYIGNGFDPARLYKCPIDDVLWYAKHLSAEKDVIAVANYSDGTVNDFKSAAFYLPKNASFADMKLLCSGGYDCALLSIEEYRGKIAEVNGELEKKREDIYDELRRYAETSEGFMRKVGIAEEDRLGLVSIIVLALTNQRSDLYAKVRDNELKIAKEDIRSALLEAEDVNKLGVIVSDQLPQERTAILKTYIERVLLDSELGKDKSATLNEWDKKDKTGYFSGSGNSILSRLTYSLYNNIIKKYDYYKGSKIDIMGTFYSLFLVYYASDKKKGIVLTPAHVTDLFCEIAEYFGGKFTDKTKILDICTGSGGFLIAALHKIDSNIDKDPAIPEDKKSKVKEFARKNALIGAENAPSMYMLAYANMRFHGDGKSRLYNLDCLLSSDADKTLTFGAELRKLYDPSGCMEGSPIEEVFKAMGADAGMINPPYGKDYNEYDFINAELKYLKKGGIGLAIVPVSNQGISKNKEKTAILEQHSLLASILMPPQLFVNVRNSGASVGTCILVFRAHVPHQEFLKDNGETFLADWREDGFKMINKHGRFEWNGQWYAPENGYKELYLEDMRRAVSRDYDRQCALDQAYSAAFPEEDAHKVSLIPSTAFKKDIRKGGIKSVMVKIYGNPRTVGGKKPEIVYDNMDWNILNYVKTDYHELKDADFIKTVRNYRLFQYLMEKGLLFSDSQEENEAAV